MPKNELFPSKKRKNLQLLGAPSRTPQSAPLPLQIPGYAPVFKIEACQIDLFAKAKIVKFAYFCFFAFESTNCCVTLIILLALQSGKGPPTMISGRADGLAPALFNITATKFISSCLAGIVPVL